MLITARKRSLAQGNVFTRPVILFNGEGSLSGGLPDRDPPLDRDPPGQRPPLDGDAPWSETPPRTETPLGQSPPCTVKSGRYASYWNALLFSVLIKISYNNFPRRYSVQSPLAALDIMMQVQKERSHFRRHSP